MSSASVSAFLLAKLHPMRGSVVLTKTQSATFESWRSCKKMPRAHQARGIRLNHSDLRNRGASCTCNRANAAALI
jgi:hypothetical protein